MKFSAELIDGILSGVKTSTWRMFDDKDLQVGDEVEFMNRETQSVFATARLLSVTEKKLGEVTDADLDIHNPYESVDHMLRDFRSYYGDRVTLETPIKIITFVLIKKTAV